MKLYLDDDHDGRPTPPGWARAYDVDEAIRMIQQHEGPFEVSLDHDLGEDANGREKPNGTALVRWMSQNARFPERAQIHSANPVGRKNLEFDLAAMQRHQGSVNGLDGRVARLYKTAVWADVFAKAKRLKDQGHVIIQRNGYDNVVAMVRGDYGVYEVEFQRQDPNSRSISMWSCTCPWAQFVWYRTGPWKKYEGRVCSHCLAAYWAAKGTPLDEDALEQYEQQEEIGQKVETPLDDLLPGGDEGPPGGPGAEMLDGPEEDLPDELDDILPEELPVEPDLTQGPLPTMPELPFKPQGEKVEPEAQKGEMTQPNPIEQGLLDIQKQLGPEQVNFLKQKYPQFFNIPGTLSHVHAAGGDDFDVILEMLYPGPGKNAQSPTGQMLKPEWGEYRGGVHPHPEAKPARTRADGSPIYNLEDMGWNPNDPRPGATPVSYGSDGTPIFAPEDYGYQETQDRVHKVPERRGDYGEIPAGAKVSIQDADKTTGWVLVNWPVEDTDYCQHRMVEAWVEARNVKLIGSERLGPFIKRRGPQPTDEENWQTGTASDDWA